MNDMGYGSHGILWYFMMFRYFDLKTRPHEARMLHLSLSVLRMQMLPIDIDACTEEEAFQADSAKGWFIRSSVDELFAGHQGAHGIQGPVLQLPEASS